MIQHDSIFAKTSAVEITYNDLSLFCRFLVDTIKSKTGLSSPLVVLQAESTIVTVQIIASFWLSKIPFIVIPENATIHEISSFLKDLNPDIIIGNERFLMDVKKLDYLVPFIPSYLLTSDKINEQISKSDLENVHISSESANSDNKFQRDNDLIFAYLFTSGTTNNPKCVPITRAQITAATESTLRSLPIDFIDQWLLTIPLNHIGGISIITRSLILGSSLRYIPKFDVEIIKNILTHESTVTFCSLVPTQLQKIMQDTSFKVHSKFKCILLGGGPIPETIIEKARSRNIPVIPSFGMTETTAQCIAVPFSDITSAPSNSCGKPLHGVEVQVRPIQTSDVDSQKMDLLWVRGPQVLNQYYNKRNNHVFDHDGWFNTEDFAEIDSDGYVRILMRRTDRIVSGGENVNPVEVENLLLQMPGLSDVAVVGMPDEIWGQKIVAVVSLNTTYQQVNLDDIKSFLSDKVAPFKVPKELKKVDTIPRTSSGKIKRFELIEMILNT